MSNWNLPTLASTYTNVLTEIDGKQNDVARWFSTAYTAATNMPAGTVRWNASNNNWEKWSGSAWAALTSLYGIDVASVGGYAATSLLKSNEADSASGNLTFSGTCNFSSTFQLGGVTLTATATELNKLDGVTSTTAELNIMDGVTATATDLNRVAGGLNTKVIEIGDWNMDTSINVNVAHGVTYAKIRSVAVLIRTDDDVQHYPLNHASTFTGLVSGGYYCSSTNLRLERMAGGQFDDPAYNSTSYNRGWVVITYTD